MTRSTCGVRRRAVWGRREARARQLVDRGEPIRIGEGVSSGMGDEEARTMGTGASAGGLVAGLHWCILPR